MPSSIRLVSRPMSATAVMASKSFGICGIHAVAKPASSASRASAQSLSTLPAWFRDSGPIMMPIRIAVPYLFLVPMAVPVQVVT